MKCIACVINIEIILVIIVFEFHLFYIHIFIIFISLMNEYLVTMSYIHNATSRIGNNSLIILHWKVIYYSMYKIYKASS